MAALSTTYGVGELSAINGIAGSFAEFLPVFHLVGMPASNVQKARRLVHHTLGNGEFDIFYDMAAPVVCARAIVTPENCIAETERLIAAALQERRPVYLGFPSDYANMPVVDTVVPSADHRASPATDPALLNAAVTAIVDALGSSRTACIVPGILVSRAGLADKALAVVNASNLPFTTMFMDKCVLDESHPNYIGMYDGKLMNERVCAFVEGCDCVMGIGAMLTDFNSGSFTARIDRSKSINIMPSAVRVGNASYDNVRVEDVLTELARRFPARRCLRRQCKDWKHPSAILTVRSPPGISIRGGNRC